MSIPLGSFDLIQPIGRGGMGMVWRGLHRDQGVPVAIKVMTGERARRREYIDAFHNEVQAVARLHHPGIVMVLDQGQIGAESATRSQGRLIAGSPFLAMEFATLGSVERLPKPLTWPHLRIFLMTLLDALAHAHARGVIHRDLKPENVLLCGLDDLRPGLKLTDFGLAHAADTEMHQSETGPVAGTPLYMSPEQCHGHFRDYGPWTDLYSLGCIAYELAAGEPPFVTDSPMIAMTAHVNHEPPRLEAETPVPAGFADWVERLLQKNLRDRFQCAADAAWALARLGDPGSIEELSMQAQPATHEPRLTLAGLTTMIEPAIEGAPPAPSHHGLDASEMGPSSEWLAAARDAILSGSWAVAGEQLPTLATSTEVGVVSTSHRPPMPESWQRGRPPAPSMRLVGAGLGLYGLRTIPLVDRDAERDLIWELLRSVRQTRRPQLLVVRGSAGIGKSRLIGWMTERAVELGAASLLKAVHSPNGGPADGLGPMLAHHLRCLGLGRDAVLARTERLLRAQGVTDAYEWNALAEVVVPSATKRPERTSQTIRFANPIARFIVIRRLLQRESTDRPILVWLDDLQWGPDALALAQYVMKEPGDDPLPVLFLLTLRDEALEERPLEISLLERVMSCSDTRECRLDPLDEPYRSALVQQLLGLEGELAAQVAERTSGNPLFAVQLVGDWVERGVLIVGRTGFELRPGERAIIPDDIHQLWEARTERLIADIERAEPGRGVEGWCALQVAALLGQVVDTIEWRAACETAGVTIPGSLIYRLVTSNLARSTEMGWAFVHGMLRESLERRAREDGRAQSLHRACAVMLQNTYRGEQIGLAERIGRHLLASGDREAAIEPLLGAARERLEHAEFAQAHRLLDEREVALKRLGVIEDDRRWCAGWLLRAHVYSVEEQHLDEGHAWAQQAAELARRNGWDDLLATALTHIGYYLDRRADLTQAHGVLEEARRLFDEQLDPRGVAACLGRLGNIAFKAGDRRRAQELFEQARVLCELHHDELGVAGHLLRLSDVARDEGRLRESTQLAERAQVLFERLGNQLGVAAALNALGETARMSGDVVGAEAGYRGALARYDAIGSGRAIFPRLNLSLLLLARSRYAEARAELEPLVAVCERRGHRALLRSLQCLLLPCAAAAEDWGDWDRRLTTTIRLLDESGPAEKDDAWAVHLAADLAWRAGQQDRARQAYRLARRAWEQLGRPARVAEIDAVLSRSS